MSQGGRQMSVFNRLQGWHGLQRAQGPKSTLTFVIKLQLKVHPYSHVDCSGSGQMYCDRECSFPQGAMLLLTRLAGSKSLLLRWLLNINVSHPKWRYVQGVIILIAILRCLYPSRNTKHWSKKILPTWHIHSRGSSASWKVSGVKELPRNTTRQISRYKWMNEWG